MQLARPTRLTYTAARLCWPRTRAHTASDYLILTPRGSSGLVLGCIVPSICPRQIAIDGEQRRSDEQAEEPHRYDKRFCRGVEMCCLRAGQTSLCR